MTTSGYLEHYLDSLESLPGEVRRNFTLMCDLDTKNKNILQVRMNRFTTTVLKAGLCQACLLNIFKKLKAKKTQPPKKLKGISGQKTQGIGIF